MEQSKEQAFSYDEIPPQCKMFSAAQPLNDLSILVHHVEASYQVKKHLFDVACKVFPDKVQDSIFTMYMALAEQKNQFLNEKMDKFLAEQCGFGEGQKFEDKNTLIIYKTFLDSSTDDKADLMELLELYALQES